MPVFGAAPSPEEFSLEDLFQAGAFGDRNNWLEISDSDLMDFGITDVNQRLNLLQGRGVEGVISSLFPDLSNVNPQALLGDRGLNEGFVPGFTQQNIFSDTNPLSHPLANLGGDYYHSNVGYSGENPFLEGLLSNFRDTNPFAHPLANLGGGSYHSRVGYDGSNPLLEALGSSYSGAPLGVGSVQDHPAFNAADSFFRDTNPNEHPLAGLTNSFPDLDRNTGNPVGSMGWSLPVPGGDKSAMDRMLEAIGGGGGGGGYTPSHGEIAPLLDWTNALNRKTDNEAGGMGWTPPPILDSEEKFNPLGQYIQGASTGQSGGTDLRIFDDPEKFDPIGPYTQGAYTGDGGSLQILDDGTGGSNSAWDDMLSRVNNPNAVGGSYSELDKIWDSRGDDTGLDTIYTPDGGSVGDHPAAIWEPKAVDLPDDNWGADWPAGKLAFSPDFSPNFSPTFAPDFANMFAGFNPLEGLQLTPEGGAGGSATVTNLFGDQGIFGGNPLLGQGAVEGGNVDFKQGAFDFGDMISSPLIDKGAFAGMIGPDAFDFSDFIGKDAFDFSNMISSPLVDQGAFDFSNMISSPLIDKDAFDFSNFIGKDAFDFTDMISSPLIDRNAFSGMIGPEAFDFTGMISPDAFDLSNTFDRGAFDFGNMNTGLLGEGAIQINDSLPDWLTNPFDIYQNIRPHMEENIRDMIPDLFPQGVFQDMMEEIIGDPIAGMQADIQALKSGGLLAELNKLDALADVTVPSGETAEPFAGMASGDHFMEGPRLSMPEIMDYSQALQMPMYDNIIKSLDAANPYDTRRDDILGGQNAYLDEIYDEKRANLENRFAVMDNLGSPGFREAMKDLEEDRARAKMGVTSQFGQEAARTDESTRRGRVSDLASALGFETGRVRDEMAFQDQLQRQATSDFNNYMEQIFRSYMAPQDSYDNALRMMLGGLGTAIQPNIGAAMTGLGGQQGAIGAYQDKMNQNTRNMQMMMNPGAFRNFER